MILTQSGGAAPAKPVETNAQRFAADVIEASRTQLVVVDFWADWCGPCKTLTPILEKVVAATGGRARLVTVNTDKNQMLAAQFRIQSLPTVYAFLDGRPVDGFMGAQSEAQVRAFVERLLSATPAGDDVAGQRQALLEAATEAMALGETEEAEAIFRHLLDASPGDAGAAAGLAGMLIERGDIDEAQALLAGVKPPADGAADAQAINAELARLRASLTLAREAVPPDALAGLRAAVDADPDDQQARYDLASALMAAGDHSAAADMLLASIARDRNWQDGAARSKLLTLMEAVGLDQPFSMATRRRLSAILFA